MAPSTGMKTTGASNKKKAKSPTNKKSGTAGGGTPAVGAKGPAVVSHKMPVNPRVVVKPTLQKMPVDPRVVVKPTVQLKKGC